MGVAFPDKVFLYSSYSATILVVFTRPFGHETYLEREMHGILRLKTGGVLRKVRGAKKILMSAPLLPSGIGTIGTIGTISTIGTIGTRALSARVIRSQGRVAASERGYCRLASFSRTITC